MKIRKYQSLTVKYDGIPGSIMCEVGVSLPFNPQTTPESQSPPLKKYLAIWDTGASITVVTEKVVDELDLKPITKTTVRGVHGEEERNVYLMNLFFENGARIFNVKVVSCKSLSDGGDLLLGMDIICIGDFSITNKNKKTVMSFRTPSLETIDFVKKQNAENLMNKVTHKKSNKGTKKKKTKKEIRQNRKKNKK